MGNFAVNYYAYESLSGSSGGGGYDLFGGDSPADSAPVTGSRKFDNALVKTFDASVIAFGVGLVLFVAALIASGMSPDEATEKSRMMMSFGLLLAPAATALATGVVATVAAIGHGITKWAIKNIEPKIQHYKIMHLKDVPEISIKNHYKNSVIEKISNMRQGDVTQEKDKSNSL